MPFHRIAPRERVFAHKARAALVSVYALGAVVAAASAASAGSLTRTMDVDAPPAAVWSTIGPFCAIKDWHPLVGVCVTDGKAPPIRTLVTKDGKVSFVETEKARDDVKYSYSYDFVASPLPTTKYLGTISVKPNGHGSTIVWHGDFVALPGKEKDVETALAGVYESGLAALKARFH